MENLVEGYVVPTARQLIEERLKSREVILSELRGNAGQWIGRRALYSLVVDRIRTIQGGYTPYGLKVDLEELSESGEVSLSRSHVVLDARRSDERHEVVC